MTHTAFLPPLLSVQPRRVFPTPNSLVSAESGQKASLGARRGRRCTGHAVTSPTTAHSETGQDEEDHRSKGDPEALTKRVSTWLQVNRTNIPGPVIVLPPKPRLPIWFLK